MYNGVVEVPPILMVDDILTINKCSPTAVAMNSTVNAFIESKKKLKLSHKKCIAIHVGKNKGYCLVFKVHEQDMHKRESSKNLGDLFHSSGKSRHNILEGSTKACAILAEIKAILNYVPLGKYRVEAGLHLRQSMFLNGVLFNSEVWQGLDATHLTMLQTVDHQMMRVVCHIPIPRLQ